MPYVSVDSALPELTWLSIFCGIIFAVIFGAANTYLGLKVGMTIAEGLPATILATGILKGLLKHNNVLEINVIQAMASMGESLAGGLIFCIPAVIILGGELTLTTIAVVGILSGLLGIAFVVPLRRFLIIEEHGNLLYPEGMAASEVLVSPSLVAWMGLIPLIKFFGAGAVAAGGFISVIKNIPTFISSFKSAMAGMGHKNNAKKTDLDVPMTWVIGVAVLVFVVAWFFPMAGAKMGAVGDLLVLIVAFFFAVVSAILCGATICVSIAVAGGAAQSLKTTHIIGGTPRKVEIGMGLAIIASASVVGFVILMLNQAYGIGSAQIAAPQATIMSMISKGIINGNLPWDLVFIGAKFGIMAELMRISVLPFALGLYLPIHLSAGVVFF